MSLAVELAERGLVPDSLIRFGIRKLLGQRIAEEQARYRRDGARRQFIEDNALNVRNLDV